MIAQQLERYFATRAADGNVVAVWLFGSVARGDDGDRSDVDVAVLYRRDPQRTFDALPLRLEGEIERLLGRRAEVVCLNLAPVDLCARVLRDGVLLVDQDPALRIGFEVRTRNLWFDLQPVLRTIGGFSARLSQPFVGHDVRRGVFCSSPTRCGSASADDVYCFFAYRKPADVRA